MGKEEEPKKESDLRWVRDIEEIERISDLPNSLECSIEDKRLKLINLYFDKQRESIVSDEWKMAFSDFIDFSIERYSIKGVAIEAFRVGIIFGKYIKGLEDYEV